MSSDRTPADVIAELLEHLDMLAGDFVPEARSCPIGCWPLTIDDVHGMVRILAAAGFRVSLIPDDNTRAEVEALVPRLRDPYAAWMDGDELHRAGDLLAAAHLDGQPQDRPAHCPTDDDGELPEAFCVVLDELIVLKPDGPFDREQVARSIVAMLSEAGLLVGGSGDTR